MDHFLMRWIGFILFCCMVFGACQHEGEDEETALLTEVNISLDSAKFQRLYDWRDRWQRDSLLPYLSHRDPSFRAFTAGLFGDVMQSGYSDALGALIGDPVTEVRRAAVYSLGQSRSELAVPYLMQVFDEQDSLGIDPLTFKYALEAIGKCADSTYLPLLADISTYQSSDTLLLEGQCLGMFQLAQRGFAHPDATKRAMEFISDTLIPPSVRLIAAHYLVTVSSDLEDFQEPVQSAFAREEDPEIRMFLGQLMGQTGNGSLSWINEKMRKEPDVRVRVQILRGVQHLPLRSRHQILATALRDPHEWVSRLAGDLLLEFGDAAYADTYTNWAFAQYPPAIYARVLATGNRYVTNARFLEMIQDLIFQRIRTTSDPFLKADFIWAAGQHPNTAVRLMGLNTEETDFVNRTAVIESVVHSVREYGYASNRIINFLSAQWMSGDVSAVSLISPLIEELPDLFSEISGNEKLWQELEEKMELPREIEARLQLDKARSMLFNHTLDPNFYQTGELHSHAIDWDLYEQLSTRPRAEIVTSAGNMEIELLKTEAPGTVVNFIVLAESGYYNGKFIHRVVPNFVIQGGGNRGDGYGSMDYTIRTEVPPGYFDHSGWVGMASAGPHTESQQWFITHRPTLHLSGQYSRFGRLIAGREVLMEIKRGDVIKEIKIHR